MPAWMKWDGGEGGEVGGLLLLLVGGLFCCCCFGGGWGGGLGGEGEVTGNNLTMHCHHQNDFCIKQGQR